MAERRGAGTVLISGGIGAALGATVATLLAAPPAEAAPPSEKLDYLIELHTLMVEQLQRLVEIAEQPIVIQPTAISIEPRTITEFIEAFSSPGRTFGRFNGCFAMAAPAGTTNQYAFRIAAGFISICRTPYIFTSDFYDPNLTLEVWIEENRIPVTLGPIPMTGPRTLTLDFKVKRYGMDFEIVNGTATDALVTVESMGFWIEKSYFDEFYLPLVNKIYQAAEALL